MLSLILVFKNQAANVDNDKSPVNDDEADDEINEAILTTPFIPEPVFFCSIEPPSIAAQKQVRWGTESNEFELSRWTTYRGFNYLS